MSALRALRDTLGAIYQLARLFALSGFRRSAPYWAWRTHTAIGNATMPKRELVRAALEYGRWVHRMRRHL